MNLLYAAFHPDPLSVAVRAMDLLTGAYPDLDHAVGASAIQLIATDASATMQLIEADRRIGESSEMGLGFTVADETQESVGLCWSAFVAVALGYSCPVWISQRTYNAATIRSIAPFVPWN